MAKPFSGQKGKNSNVTLAYQLLSFYKNAFELFPFFRGAI